MNEHWWVDDRHSAQLEAVAPLRVAAWIEAARRGQVLSSDRQSIAARLVDAGLLVKWRHTLPARRRKTLGRPSRERREAQGALCARALGIPGPRPWAVGEVRGQGLLLASVLIRPFDPQARSAADVLAADKTASVPLARQLRRWHATGWRHGDCYPKNLLLLSDQKTFAPIGYPSARFYDAGHEDAACAKDIAQLCVGVQALQSVSVDEVFDAYAPDALPHSGLRELVDKRIEVIRARKAERERTRPGREPGGPPTPSPFAAKPAKVVVEDLLELV